MLFETPSDEALEKGRNHDHGISDLKKKNPSTAGYEPIISQTITETIEDLTETNTDYTSTVNISLQEDPADEQDESTPLTSQPHPRATNSMTTNLISHCSSNNKYILLKRFVSFVP